MRTLNDLKIVLKYLDYILQNPKLALPLPMQTIHDSVSVPPGSVNARYISMGKFYAHTYLQPYGCHSEFRLRSATRHYRGLFATELAAVFARFCACLANNPRCYERIDPVGLTTPRPSRDPHRSQIPGPVHNPVARTPRSGHQAAADAVTHPHRRRRPLGSRGHVVLVVVRHVGRCHAVAHAGRFVGCRPRLGSIGITDINNGRR